MHCDCTGDGECGFPLLLYEDKLLHIVIMQQDMEYLRFIK